MRLLIASGSSSRRFTPRPPRRDAGNRTRLNPFPNLGAPVAHLVIVDDPEGVLVHFQGLLLIQDGRVEFRGSGEPADDRRGMNPPGGSPGSARGIPRSAGWPARETEEDRPQDLHVRVGEARQRLCDVSDRRDSRSGFARRHAVHDDVARRDAEPGVIGVGQEPTGPSRRGGRITGPGADLHDPREMRVRTAQDIRQLIHASDGAMAGNPVKDEQPIPAQSEQVIPAYHGPGSDPGLDERHTPANRRAPGGCGNRIR